MQVNAASREITCKVVYYGPGMSGKTTNLKIIHDRSPQQNVGELITLDTHSERTLHFDLLPVDMGRIRGYTVRFEFFTVPGQSYYAATRRLVLEGADGVVFVADSRREALDENIDSMNDLLDNLRHHQLPEDLPVVIQYNKQDLATALKPEQLDPLLNIRRWARFTAIATTGVGVLETMKSIATSVMERVERKTDLPASGGVPQLQIPQMQRTWLITCYRCHNMLETNNSKQGDMFTCGACGTALEISNLEHGVTRSPANATATQPLPNLREESGGYSLQPINGPAAGSALAAGPGAMSAANEGIPGSVPFEIEGFDQLALLDETVQGRRFRVRERATGTRYRALVLSPTLMRQPGYQAQVEQYARMASQIKHPHLLPLASLRPGRECPVLLSSDPTDYESLSHVLARRRLLAPPHALGIARQIVLSLEEAARHGVVHGWLRPDIILLSPEGNVLVDEYGVPKNHRFLVRELSGASAATEYYLAPEHLGEDSRSDVRSDIFMFGAVLFRMITGEGLVTGYNAHEALHKVVATGCRSLRTVQSSISRDLDAFFMRLVTTERKDRFQNYKEILETLERFGGGAKRATLRLTQNVSTGSTIGSGTRGTSRPQTGRSASGGSGSGGVTRRAAGGGSGANRVLGGDSAAPRPRPAPPSSSNSTPWIVIGGLVLAAVVIAMVLSNKGSRIPVDLTRTHSGDNPPSTTPLLLRKPAPDPKMQDTPFLREIDKVPAGPKTAKPADPMPVPVKVADKPELKPDPKVAKLPATGAPAASDADLKYQITQLEQKELFQQALDACAKFSNAEARDSRMNDVSLGHDNRKNELADTLRAATSVAQAQELLAPALNKWGMPNDVEWAQDRLAEARARLPAGAVVDNGGGETKKPVEPVQTEAPSNAASSDALLAADGQVDQALIKCQLTLAEQAVAGLDQNLAEVKAMRRKIDLWSSRADILGSVIRERHAKLRITHPTENTLWDVTDAERSGVTVASVTGSSAKLDWTQISTKDLGRIAQEAATLKDSQTRDHALATVMLLLANETALASVQVMRAKAVLDEPMAHDLEKMISLRRQREIGDLLRRGNEAVTAGDGNALDEVVTQLQRSDRASLPAVAAQLPRLQQMLQRMIEGKSTADVAMKDSLTFDSPDDLSSFPLRHGAWEVAAGRLNLTAEAGTLERKDLATAKSVNIAFENQAGKGAMTVNFRGIRVLVEFAQKRITVSSRDQDLKPRDFHFVGNTLHTLYIQANKDSDVVAVEVNNGAEIFDLRTNSLSDQMSISIDTGAVVSFDEITIARDATRIMADPAAEHARLESVRKQTGFEPIGGVYLDPPKIVLPASASTASGIGFLLRDTVASLTLEVKGKGKLRFMIGELGRGDGDWVDVDLPANAEAVATFTVSWNGKLVIMNAQGLAIAENAKITKSTHLMILALSEAVILRTQVNRQ